MLAIRVYEPGGPDALVMEQLPLPEPGHGEVRVKSSAIGVGRVDVLIREGTYKWMPPLPATPGTELVGVIDAVGQEVSSLHIGQRVLVSARDLPTRGGCYVESIVVPEAAPYILPDAIPTTDALNLPNLQLAIALLQAANCPKHVTQQHVLITGAAGGVATMLSQLARHHGLRTIGTARSSPKREFALAHGFDVVIDADPQTLTSQVMQVTQGEGVHLVFDHLGGSYLPACMRSLAPLGLAVSYNIITGKPDTDLFALMREMLSKSLAIRCFSMHTFDADVTNRRSLMQRAIDLMASGVIKAPSATHLSLNEVAKAHQILDEGLTLGKIVLLPND